MLISVWLFESYFLNADIKDEYYIDFASHLMYTIWLGSYNQFSAFKSVNLCVQHDSDVMLTKLSKAWALISRCTGESIFWVRCRPFCNLKEKKNIRCWQIHQNSTQAAVQHCRVYLLLVEAKVGHFKTVLYITLTWSLCQGLYKRGAGEKEQGYSSL